MRHDAEWARQQFAQAQVARLAAVSGDGSPHLVPMVFALDGARLIGAVDHKPKSTTDCGGWTTSPSTHSSACSSMIATTPNWKQLSWARAEGSAQMYAAYDLTALIARYPQYREQPPDGPVIVIEVDHSSGWSAE